jgi:hypothetical protein
MATARYDQRFDSCRCVFSRSLIAKLLNYSRAVPCIAVARKYYVKTRAVILALKDNHTVHCGDAIYVDVIGKYVYAIRSYLDAARLFVESPHCV